MLIDDKGRIFGKISIIDILLVLIVLSLVIFGVSKMGISSSKDDIAKNNNKIQITFYQEDVNDFTAKSVNIGDPGTEALRNIGFGNVIGVEIGQPISWGPDEDGIQVSTPREGYSSIHITLEANGSLGPNGITLSGSNYYIGEKITFRVGNAVFFGRISDAK